MKGKRILAIVLGLLLVLCSSACSVQELNEIIDIALDSTDTTTVPAETGRMFETTKAGKTTTVQETEPGSFMPEETVPASTEEEIWIPAEDGIYDSKEEVARYIHIYGKLPQNYITKKEAEKLGWTGGSLERYAPGKCIGGSYFGNYEGLLPEAKGRTYTECDIDTLGASSRGKKRIVFSNDGLIYYTDDHYDSFTLLYTADGEK